MPKIVYNASKSSAQLWISHGLLHILKLQSFLRVHIYWYLYSFLNRQPGFVPLLLTNKFYLLNQPLYPSSTTLITNTTKFNKYIVGII